MGRSEGGGNIAETLVSYCSSKGADLVIVGSRGLGSLQRSMLGMIGLAGLTSDTNALFVKLSYLTTVTTWITCILL